MKKYFCFLICALLLLIGCENDYGLNTYKPENDPNVGIAVFDVEKEIIDVEFNTSINNIGLIEISPEQLDEIVEWLGTFKTTRKNEYDTWVPGTGSVQLTIYYADGTTFAGNISNTTIDGVGYYIDGDNAPDFWPDLFNTEGSEDE